MSWLSVGLREIGLGGVVDAFDGIEPAVKAAVSTPAVVQVEDNTVAALGNAANAVVQNAVNKVAPGAGTVEAEVSAPFLSALETFVEGFFQNATTSVTKT